MSKGTQLERLMARNNLSKEEAQQRIAAQLSLAEKRQRAEIVIDNNGALSDTLKQVQALLDKERR